MARPPAVLFDERYANVGNLKRMQQLGWVFVTRYKVNRKVWIDHGELRLLGDQQPGHGGGDAGDVRRVVLGIEEYQRGLTRFTGAER